MPAGVGERPLVEGDAVTPPVGSEAQRRGFLPLDRSWASGGDCGWWGTCRSPWSLLKGCDGGVGVAKKLSNLPDVLHTVSHKVPML